MWLREKQDRSLAEVAEARGWGRFPPPGGDPHARPGRDGHLPAMSADERGERRADERSALRTAHGGAGRRCQRGRDDGVSIGQSPEDPRAQDPCGQARRRLRARPERRGADPASGAPAPGGGADGEGDAHPVRAGRASTRLERRVGPPLSPRRASAPRPPRRPAVDANEGWPARGRGPARSARRRLPHRDRLLRLLPRLAARPADAREDAARFFALLDGR